MYFTEGALDDADPRVIALSGLLRSLPIHAEQFRRHRKFRNPNGVSLKLQNFLALDPDYGGTAGAAAAVTLMRRAVYAVRQAAHQHRPATATAWPMARAHPTISRAATGPDDGHRRLLEKRTLAEREIGSIRQRDIASWTGSALRRASAIADWRSDFAQP